MGANRMLSALGGLALLMASVGIGLGLAGATVLTRVFARAMSGVGELDAATCVAVSVLLAAVALLASCLPARKALRVDAAQALRCE